MHNRNKHRSADCPVEKISSTNKSEPSNAHGTPLSYCYVFTTTNEEYGSVASGIITTERPIRNMSRPVVPISRIWPSSASQSISQSRNSEYLSLQLYNKKLMYY